MTSPQDEREELIELIGKRDYEYRKEIADDVLAAGYSKHTTRLAQVREAKLNGKYPYIYHDKSNWGRVGVSYAQSTDFVRVDMMLEDKQGAIWQVVDMTPDEAEQMGLRLLERVYSCREALAALTAATGGGE